MSPQCVRQTPVLWAIRDKQHRVTLFSGERFVSWLQLNNFSPLAHAMSLCRDQETFLLPRGRVGERADAVRHSNEGEWASLMLQQWQMFPCMAGLWHRPLPGRRERCGSYAQADAMAGRSLLGRATFSPVPEE